MHRQFGERMKATVERGVFVLPHQAHDRERFFHAGATFFEVRSMHVVLKWPPTHPHTERDASAGNLIDGRHLFGHANRIVNWKLKDAGSDSHG